MTEGKAPIWLRLVRVYREKGLGGVWFGALSRAGYRRLVLLARRLDEPVTPVPPRARVDVRLLRREDEAAFEALGQGDAGVFRRRLEAGHQCWGAWCSGGLHHVAWLAFRLTQVEYLRCRLLLHDDVAYVYRAYTEPQYRRLGLGPATQTVCLQALREQGYRVVLAAVLPDNPWAFPPWLSVGYRRIAVIRALGTGPRPRVIVTLDSVPGPGGWKVERCRGDASSEADDPA
jgi:ribosomal protein S18 acetylase RimI-like enzyme